MTHPLVYVASLRRTGSTVLSEALTGAPHAFIFREPRLTGNQFRLQPGDVELLARDGIDLHKLLGHRPIVGRLSRKLRIDSSYMVRVFSRRVVPALSSRIGQIGIKEVHHRGWQKLLPEFPNMRVVMTGRDPRDIYLSIDERRRADKGGWTGPFTVEAVARELNKEFRRQQAMTDATRYLKVRYEDLCLDPAKVLSEVRSFVQSPMPDVGAIGALNARQPERTNESDLHGARVTTKRVARWRVESDPARRHAAESIVELMPEYCAFWGYELS